MPNPNQHREATMTEHRLAHLEAAIGELATVVIGPERPMLAGGGRDESKGIAAQFAQLQGSVVQLRDQLTAGVEVRVPWGKITTLVSAIVTAVGAITVALLESTS